VKGTEQNYTETNKICVCVICFVIPLSEIVETRLERPINFVVPAIFSHVSCKNSSMGIVLHTVGSLVYEEVC
jgi:hypothetical protein